MNELFGGNDDEVSFLICDKEYDSPELKMLLAWFKNYGWSSEEESWDAAGSQEITVYEASKGSVTVKLVFETYEGVTLFTTPENEHLFSDIKINK